MILSSTAEGFHFRSAIIPDEPEAMRMLAQFKAMLSDRPVRENTTKGTSGEGSIPLSWIICVERRRRIGLLACQVLSVACGVR